MQVQTWEHKPFDEVQLTSLSIMSITWIGYYIDYSTHLHLQLTFFFQRDDESGQFLLAQAAPFDCSGCHCKTHKREGSPFPLVPLQHWHCER
jgi:hypothetical protein